MEATEETAMNNLTSDHDRSLWEHLVECHLAFLEASRTFLSDGVDRVTQIQAAVRGTRTGRLTAIYILRWLKPTELVELFPQLVALASWGHGSVGAVREAILRIPREWVLDHIREQAEPHLANGTYDEYRRFLELYIQLDRELTLELARRALESDDPDIHEAGEDFMKKLGTT